MQENATLRSARISTLDFPEQKRLAMWREVYGRGITQVDIEPIGDAPFHADVTLSMLPNVSIVAVRAHPRTTASRPSLRGGAGISSR